jgi:hypothetical protein
LTLKVPSSTKLPLTRADTKSYQEEGKIPPQSKIALQNGIESTGCRSTPQHAAAVTTMMRVFSPPLLPASVQRPLLNRPHTPPLPPPAAANIRSSEGCRRRGMPPPAAANIR